MNKGPDNLTLCSIAAMQAGMSYGQFMALGGYAKVAKRAEELKPEFPTRVCMHCGKVFSMEGRSHLSKYCSPERQKKAGAERALARYYEKRREKNVNKGGSEWKINFRNDSREYGSGTI